MIDILKKLTKEFTIQTVTTTINITANDFTLIPVPQGTNTLAFKANNNFYIIPFSSIDYIRANVNEDGVFVEEIE